jgi:hypothetical protein
MADFEKLHGRANAHGEAITSPGFDTIHELNDWLSGDTEWLWEEVTRYRRVAWTGSQPRDEIIDERGLSLLDEGATPMPLDVRQGMVDLFDRLTNEDRLGRGQARQQRGTVWRPEETMDPRTPMLGYDQVYNEDGTDKIEWDRETGWPKS